jgi:hypothetical protein
MGVVERSFRKDRVFGLFLGSVVNVQLCVLFLTGTCDAFMRCCVMHTNFVVDVDKNVRNNEVAQPSLKVGKTRASGSVIELKLLTQHVFYEVEYIFKFLHSFAKIEI